MKILLLVVLSYPARVLGYSARRVRNDPSLIDALLRRSSSHACDTCSGHHVCDGPQQRHHII